MTVKKLTTIENGRLAPTNLSLDADLIEVSKEVGNELEVKEDGLFYKQPDTLYEDGLTEKESNRVGIEDYGIDLDKLKNLVVLFQLRRWILKFFSAWKNTSLTCTLKYNY